MLFRFSALIFYGHRIHYDIDYTRDVEGYPGLVVHGPLTASLLIDEALKQNHGRVLTGFQIRAMSPLFSPTPFRVEGKLTKDGADTWAKNEEGNLAMTVSLTFK